MGQSAGISASVPCGTNPNSESHFPESAPHARRLPSGDINHAAEGAQSTQLCDGLRQVDLNGPAIEKPEPETETETQGGENDGEVGENKKEENEKRGESDNNENVTQSDEVPGDGDHGVENRNEGTRAAFYPVRPGAVDCAFYMKYGGCKFGMSCKFNHPPRRINQDSKEMAGEDLKEKPGSTECKYYHRTGGCRYGNACKFSHSRGSASPRPVAELNFLGLPIRLGEKDCPFYMRTASCKYGANCKFNHPDPTTVGDNLAASVYANGVYSQASVPAWSSTGPLTETASALPSMVAATQGVQSQNPGRNGHQDHGSSQEEMKHPPTAHFMNSTGAETSVPAQQEPKTIEEFPERQGELICGYFLKTGDCKFKSNCKYYHPKNQVVKQPQCPLNDKGLPLRPGQAVCTHYDRYGICKYGPACKFDHPTEPSSPHPGEPEQPSVQSDPLASEEAGRVANESGSGGPGGQLE